MPEIFLLYLIKYDISFSIKNILLHLLKYIFTFYKYSDIHIIYFYLLYYFYYIFLFQLDILKYNIILALILLKYLISLNIRYICIYNYITEPKYLQGIQACRNLNRIFPLLICQTFFLMNPLWQISVDSQGELLLLRVKQTTSQIAKKQKLKIFAQRIA